MGTFVEFAITTFALAVLFTLSIKSSSFWQTQSDAAPLHLRVPEIAFGLIIYFLINLSSLFFNDQFARISAALVAAGTYFAFTKLCASRNRSIWNHNRLSKAARVILVFATFGALMSSLSTAKTVLLFALLTYWEQRRFIDSFYCETILELQSLRGKLRTQQATEHNQKIACDVEDDNLNAAG